MDFELEANLLLNRTMNGFLLFFLAILVIEISVCTALKYNLWASPTVGKDERWNRILLFWCLDPRFDIDGHLNCCTANAWYLNASHSAPMRDVLQDIFSFLVVFNYIIPISLYVTLGKLRLLKIYLSFEPNVLIFYFFQFFNFPSFKCKEMQKFVGSLFFTWDEELRCPITGEIPICNSSDLNEELGQVG